MKIASIFRYFLLALAIFFMSGCSAYQLAQWSHGGGAKPPSGTGGFHSGNCCPHHPNRQNFMGSMSSTSIYAMQGEYYPFCRKCRQ